MIARAKPAHRQTRSAWTAFVQMLPAITRHARVAFRSRRGDDRDDMIQEVVANAAVAFMRLFQLGKADLAYPSVLARYGVAQVIEGRRVGNRLRIGDVLSTYCQRKKGVVVERLDKLDEDDGTWLEATVEDTHTPPADQAAFRIDFPAWLQTLGSRGRHIALTLASNETTSATAKQYGVSAARISQLRRELHDAWLEFHGEAVPDRDLAAGPA